MALLPILLSAFMGLLIGVVLMFAYNNYVSNRLGKNAQQNAQQIVTDAQKSAENIMKDALSEAKIQAADLRRDVEKDAKEKRQSLVELETKLSNKEQSIERKDLLLQTREEHLNEKTQTLNNKIDEIDKRKKEIETTEASLQLELQRIAGLSHQQARDEIFSNLEEKMSREMTAYIKEQEEEAKENATSISKQIIATAIERFANQEISERTVSVVNIPSEEMKGRIIGREGRNIRAIEQATGVDLIIDDTPEAITVSCFDPIRREVAKIALETLIKDGRIHPTRIEEVVDKVRIELDETIKEAGQEAIFKLGISKMDRELAYLVGRLKYRTSYGQNALNHSMEVAFLSGSMAAELGLNQNLAKRAGLLHDIGKALDFELEGSHIELGAKMARKHGEHPIVINSIECHHGEVEPIDPISIIVTAADTLSAARPGARSEALESYIHRLEKLEAISNEFNGVEKTYAIQAGREIRVVVLPDKLDDLGIAKLARDIKTKIETELTYPGQIKVTVIRETRATDIAR